jgi:molybdopterin synthase catalytic subunit
MQVRVRLFAVLRERAGTDVLELELPQGALVRDALARMEPLTDGLAVVMAVNQEYADPSDTLRSGDEVALIPPVSGGCLGTPPASGDSVGTLHVRVTVDPLRLEQLVELVKDPRAGAVVTFSGVTREVSELEYEAYAPMAERKIAEIVAAAAERFGLCAAAAEHRIGPVPLSEPSVVVAASAPHREEAFGGAREIIDRLKAQAPIWKKEEGRWIGGATPDTES